MDGKIAAAAVLLGALTAGACEDSTGPGVRDQVSVRFAAVQPSPAAGTVSDGSLVMTGTNGTLQIDSLFLVVDDFELKRLNDDNCDDVVDHESCEKFEAPPSFVNVPLDGTSEIAVRQQVPAGTYREFEFEVEDLDDDEENPVKAQQIAALRNQIRAQFPDWPKDASMLVVGTFTPTGGAPVAFRTYFEAEIEVEMDLVPPAVIDSAGGAPSFTVRIDPTLFFRNGNGTVLNLAALNFSTTGQVVEFEVEIENGITEIEFDH